MPIDPQPMIQTKYTILDLIKYIQSTFTFHENYFFLIEQLKIYDDHRTYVQFHFFFNTLMHHQTSSLELNILQMLLDTSHPQRKITRTSPLWPSPWMFPVTAAVSSALQVSKA